MCGCVWKKRKRQIWCCVFKSHDSEPVIDTAYKTHEENIYEINGEYVTSIMFEQEPEYGENQPSDALISQYPLEDILEEFYVVAGDMYPAENKNDPVNSYIEFSSPDIGDIQSLLRIVGKHVYNQDNGNSVLLMIE